MSVSKEFWTYLCFLLHCIHSIKFSGRGLSILLLIQHLITGGNSIHVYQQLYNPIDINQSQM